MTAATVFPEPDLHPMGTKAAILARAEALFADAGIPYRAGRMARIVGKKIANGYASEAWAAVRAEFERAEDVAQGDVRFRIRDWRGVIDPTGQLAAARVDAERESAPAGVGAKSRGEAKEELETQK